MSGCDGVNGTAAQPRDSSPEMKNGSMLISNVLFLLVGIPFNKHEAKMLHMLPSAGESLRCARHLDHKVLI